MANVTFFLLCYVLLLCAILFLLPFQKLHPKKHQPRRQAQQVRVAAAADQADTNKIAAQLRNTTLEENKS